MSSHDCRISAVISLNDGVSETDVRAALAQFLDANQMDFDAEVREGTIEIEDGKLSLELDFHGEGGYQNDDVDQLVEALSTICDGPDWLEMLDFDTGDRDAACCPEFIGTAENRLLARVMYGIEKMSDWVSPVIGKDVFKEVEAHILAIPRSQAA